MTLSVTLAAAAEHRIRALAAISADGCETGGILLGHGPDQDGRVVVGHAGDPGPHAERKPDFFLRDLHYSRRLAARAWRSDGSEWIGEWHTHPSGGARPSTLDLQTYAGILDRTPGMAVVVAIIVTPGTRGSWTTSQLTPWLIVRKRAVVGDIEARSV